MRAIANVIAFLKEHPFIRYEKFRHAGWRSNHCEEKAIRVFPSSENGFEVVLVEIPEYGPGCHQLSYAFWHTEVCDEEAAVNGFLNGLSDAVCLKVISRGGVDYRWTIGWIGGNSVGIFRYPFWKKKAIRYLQNDYFLAKEEGNTVSNSKQ
jgi:hypothetical protein